VNQTEKNEEEIQNRGEREGRKKGVETQPQEKERK